MSETAKDWHAWHAPYDEAGSSLSVRLALVQSHIRQALDAAPPGEIAVVSLCAGQGRDLLGVIEHHARASDVRALLVELDEQNAADARARAAEIGMADRVEVLRADAAVTDHYLGSTPAHLVICCGVFGNISDADVASVVRSLTAFLARDGVVIWTRHRRSPDLTGSIRQWFADAGYDEIAFTAPEHLGFVGVGAARWRGEPGTIVAGERLFEWREDPLPPT